jgi:hypothetical protein
MRILLRDRFDSLHCIFIFLSQITSLNPLKKDQSLKLYHLEQIIIEISNSLEHMIWLVESIDKDHEK